MIRMRLVLNGLMYFVVQSLHKYSVCSLASVLKYLITSLINPLGLILGKSFINELFPNCVTGKSCEFYILMTIKVGSQLSFYKGAFSHTWDTNWHNDNNRFLFEWC